MEGKGSEEINSKFSDVSFGLELVGDDDEYGRRCTCVSRSAHLSLSDHVSRISGPMRVIWVSPLRFIASPAIHLPSSRDAPSLLPHPKISIPLSHSLPLFDRSDRERQSCSTLIPPPAALIANWKVWPLIQTINFKLMPLQYRVPFQSTCGIAWTLYLSLLNAKSVKPFP